MLKKTRGSRIKNFSFAIGGARIPNRPSKIVGEDERPWCGLSEFKMRNAECPSALMDDGLDGRLGTLGGTHGWDFGNRYLLDLFASSYQNGNEPT